LETFAFEANMRTTSGVQCGLTLFWGAAEFVQLRVQPSNRSYEVFAGADGTVAKRENVAFVNADENALRFEVRGRQLSILINGKIVETLAIDSIAKRPVTPG